MAPAASAGGVIPVEARRPVPWRVRQRRRLLPHTKHGHLDLGKQPEELEAFGRGQRPHHVGLHLVKSRQEPVDEDSALGGEADPRATPINRVGGAPNVPVLLIRVDE